MAKTGQDFTIYAGDAALPVFTVVDSAGTAINLSTVQNILWNASRDVDSAPVLSKDKIGGGIEFVTDGSNGKFRVILTNADTTPLSAYYMHEAKVVDADGNVTTVTIGRMQVGRKPAWSYSGDPTLSLRDAVRFYISDTDASNPLLTDGEIDFVLVAYPSALFAAAQCARTIVGKFTKQITEKKVGDFSLRWTNQAETYRALAASLQLQAEQDGAQLFAGGACANQPFTMYQFDIAGACGPALPPCGVCGGPSGAGCGCGG